jgi:hypothetical protein
VDARIFAMVIRLASDRASLRILSGRELLTKEGTAIAPMIATMATTKSVCTRVKPRIPREPVPAGSAPAAALVLPSTDFNFNFITSIPAQNIFLLCPIPVYLPGHVSLPTDSYAIFSSNDNFGRSSLSA